MGQEASLPVQEGGLDAGQQQSSPPIGFRKQHGGDDSIRPGRAIKGIATAASSAASSAATGITSAATGITSAATGMLHTARRNEGVGNIDREVARVAAEGGHFDFARTSGSSAMTQQEQYQYPPQMTPEHQYNYAAETQQQMPHHQQQQQYYGHPPPPPPDSLTPPSSPGARAGRPGLPRPGKRILNSMRNLKLGPRGAGVSTHPELGVPGLKTTGLSSVTEWQRQWDEDDESDGEDEKKPQTNGMPMHPHMAEGRPNPDIPDPRWATPQSPERRGESATMPTQQVKAQNGMPYQPGKVGLGAIARAESDGLEWDTGVQMPQKDKPSIEMFLPMLRVLGKGSFGRVVLVQKNTGDDVGTLFAMKILKKDYLKKRRQVERTQTERKVLSVVNHPFIMKMHYAFQSEDKLFFVLDYCAGGELFFHLSRFRRFPERVARFYTAELLLAIGHLHKRHIIYRDLKPENVLIDADGHVKLGDFGLAKTGITHPCEGAMSMCGTPEYMAPEVLLQTGHGFCVDYWGIGMLVYEMMTGLPPWYTTDRAKLFRRLKSAPLEIPTFFSESCAACVTVFLERNPRRRLGYHGVKQAMDHPFFRPIQFRALYARKVTPPIRPCDGWSEAEALAAINSPNAGDAVKNEALNKTTSNFDQSFTTMPVDQEDDHAVDDYDDGDFDDSHGDNYVGFTYDETLQRDEGISSSPGRSRTHHGEYLQQPE